MRLLFIGALVATAGAAQAADMIDDGMANPRGVAEVLLGSAGFEGGLAAEFRGVGAASYWQIRPEVFINEDGRVGAAASLDWDIGRSFNLPAGNDLYIGPRVAYHNSDHDKWEIGGTAIYSLPIFESSAAERNHLEIIGAAGYLQHRSDNGDHSDRFGGTLGLAYAYQF